jgi:putative oxidoreductase
MAHATGDVLCPAASNLRGAKGMRPIRNDLVLAALRVVAGLMLVQHGVQKHLGWLLPPERTFAGAPEIWSRMWIAGTLEIVGGLLLAVGLLTRPVAFLLSGLMASAYFIAHAPSGFWPILNGGELAALYCFVFLTFSVLGGGRYSVDALLDRTPVDRPAATPAASDVPAPATTDYPNDRRRASRRKKMRVTE